MKRIDYIDAMKGIGIILVMLGHSVATLAEPLNRMILSFHMPLFFFISGMLLFGKRYRTEDFIGFIKRRVRSILVPQLTFAVITLASNFVFDILLKHDNIANLDFVSPFLAWFLLTLFVMDVVCWWMIHFTKGNKIATLAGAFLFLGGALIANFNGIKIIQQSMFAVGFGLLGYLLREFADYYNENSKVKGIGFVMLPLIAFLATLNEPIGMYMNQYGNKTLFIVFAIIGIFAVLDMASTIQASPIFLFTGKNSIILYITHPVVLRLIKAVLARTAIGEEVNKFPYCLLAFSLLMVIEIPVTLFCKKYLPLLFGMKKETENA